MIDAQFNHAVSLFLEYSLVDSNQGYKPFSVHKMPAEANRAQRLFRVSLFHVTLASCLAASTACRKVDEVDRIVGSLEDTVSSNEELRVKMGARLDAIFNGSFEVLSGQISLLKGYAESTYAEDMEDLRYTEHDQSLRKQGFFNDSFLEEVALLDDEYREIVPMNRRRQRQRAQYGRVKDDFPVFIPVQTPEMYVRSSFNQVSEKLSSWAESEETQIRILLAHVDYSIWLSRNNDLLAEMPKSLLRNIQKDRMWVRLANRRLEFCQTMGKAAHHYADCSYQ